MKMRQTMRLALLAVAGMGFAASADAAPVLIGVNFTGRGSPVGTSLGNTTAGLVPQGNWNDETGTATNPTAFVQTTPVNLIDSTGAATVGADGANPIQLTYNFPDSWHSGSGNSDGNHTLLEGVYKGGTATLTNVPAGAYKLIIYTANDTVGSGANYTATGSPLTYYINNQIGTAFTGAFVRATNTASGGTRDTGNYVQFDTVSPASNQLVIDASTSPAANGAGIDGFQLQAVPEPASLTFIALGGMGLLSRRRRALPR